MKHFFQGIGAAPSALGVETCPTLEQPRTCFCNRHFNHVLTRRSFADCDIDVLERQVWGLRGAGRRLPTTANQHSLIIRSDVRKIWVSEQHHRPPFGQERTQLSYNPARAFTTNFQVIVCPAADRDIDVLEWQVWELRGARRGPCLHSPCLTHTHTLSLALSPLSITLYS